MGYIKLAPALRRTFAINNLRLHTRAEILNSANMTVSDVTIPLLINGEEVTRSSTFDVISPSTSSVCWKAVSATPDEATKAVEAAQAALPTWSQTKPSTRTAILLKAADVLEKNVEEYATHMMTEMGADRGAAQFFVLPLAIAMCRDIAGRISSVCGSVPVVAREGQSAMVWKEPYGVCLGIVAWYVVCASIDEWNELMKEGTRPTYLVFALQRPR